MRDADSGQRQQVSTIRQARSSRDAKNGSRGNAPCRVQGQRPCWGLGQRPNCSEGDQFKGNHHNKGAGSEASLPVTLRVLRRAPKLLYPTSMQCRAKWARPRSMTSDHSLSCPQAVVSPLRRRRGGNENRRSLRSPPTPLRSTPPCNWSLIAACENGNIRKTRNIF